MSSTVAKAAEAAIQKVFSDRTVSVSVTRDHLETLRDYVNDLLASLPKDDEE